MKTRRQKVERWRGRIWGGCDDGETKGLGVGRTLIMPGRRKSLGREREKDTIRRGAKGGFVDRGEVRGITVKM